MTREYTLAAGLLAVIGLASACLRAAVPEVTSTPAHPPHWIVGHPTVPSAPRVRTVYIDDDFPPYDATEIDAAIAAWNLALNGRALLVRKPWDLDAAAGDPDAIAIYRTTDALAPRPANLQDDAIAWTDAVGGRFVWLIRDRIDYRWMRAVTLHELGHALGASDRKDVGGLLMSQGNFNPTCPDRDAVEQVSSYMGIPATDLSWCAQ